MVVLSYCIASYHLLPADVFTFIITGFILQEKKIYNKLATGCHNIFIYTNIM